MRTRPAASSGSDNAAFGVQPQGYGKDTGWRIDWQKGPMATDLASFS
jgi:hypothetical protein